MSILCLKCSPRAEIRSMLKQIQHSCIFYYLQPTCTNPTDDPSQSLYVWPFDILDPLRIQNLNIQWSYTNYVFRPELDETATKVTTTTTTQTAEITAATAVTTATMTKSITIHYFLRLSQTLFSHFPRWTSTKQRIKVIRWGSNRRPIDFKSSTIYHWPTRLNWYEM